MHTKMEALNLGAVSLRVIPLWSKTSKVDLTKLQHKVNKFFLDTTARPKLESLATYSPMAFTVIRDFLELEADLSERIMAPAQFRSIIMTAAKLRSEKGIPAVRILNFLSFSM